MSAVQSWSCETTFPASALSASASRTFVRLRLADHGLLHLCEQVELVTSELSTNAIRHAGTPFTVCLSGDGDAVQLTVTDTGDGEVADETPRRPDWWEPEGRGLLLASAMSDGWGVDPGEHGGTAVWASFEVAPAAQAG